MTPERPNHHFEGSRRYNTTRKHVIEVVKNQGIPIECGLPCNHNCFKRPSVHHIEQRRDKHTFHPASEISVEGNLFPLCVVAHRFVEAMINAGGIHEIRPDSINHNFVLYERENLKRAKKEKRSKQKNRRQQRYGHRRR